MKRMDERRGEYFGDVPRELDVEYAMYLDYDDIINLCHTQTSFRNVCENDEFWREKTEYELSKYENNYDRAKYEGNPNYGYIPLPEDKFLRKTVKYEQYHYIKHLFEMFDFSDNQVRYATLGQDIKDRKIYELLWEKLEGREEIMFSLLLRYAVKYREIHKIEKLIKSYKSVNHGRIKLLTIMDLPKEDLSDILDLIYDEQYGVFLIHSKTSSLMQNSTGREKVIMFYDRFPEKLGSYITNQINSYRSSKSRNKIVKRLEFLLDNFLVTEFEGKTRLSNAVVDELFKLFILEGESREVLESWRE